jgi:hypothetical protein
VPYDLRKGFSSRASPPTDIRPYETSYEDKAMNKLPFELLANIVDTWPRGEPLAQYRTISRVQQASIERITVQCLTITIDELEQFAAAFSSDKIHRSAHLADLHVNFI